MKAYKFTQTEKELKELEGSRIYNAMLEAERGNLKPLKEMYIRFSFGSEYLIKGYYKLQGWLFDVESYCKTYLVKLRGSDSYREYKAPNKTCLYNVLGGRYYVIDILER